MWLTMCQTPSLISRLMVLGVALVSGCASTLPTQQALTPAQLQRTVAENTVLIHTASSLTPVPVKNLYVDADSIWYQPSTTPASLHAMAHRDLIRIEIWEKPRDQKINPATAGWLIGSGIGAGVYAAYRSRLSSQPCNSPCVAEEILGTYAVILIPLGGLVGLALGRSATSRKHIPQNYHLVVDSSGHIYFVPVRR